MCIRDRINVESDLNVGSVFCFRLLTDNTYPHVMHQDSPEETENKKEEIEEILDTESGEKRILLVVEDNQDILNYIV